MRRSRAVFLQVVVVLGGIVALALMLWEPQLEGVNAHRTNFEIYFRDPFIAYAYLASIAFFVALYQAFRLFGFIGKDQAFSPDSVRALRIIKYCAIILVAMIAAAVVFIAVRGSDDIAGGVAVGVMLSFSSAVVGTAAAVFERRLRSGLERRAA